MTFAWRKDQKADSKRKRLRIQPEGSERMPSRLASLASRGSLYDPNRPEESRMSKSCTQPTANPSATNYAKRRSNTDLDFEQNTHVVVAVQVRVRVTVIVG